MSVSVDIIDSRFFIKKILFKDQNEKFIELTSLNAEIHSGNSQQVEILSSFINELADDHGSTQLMDIKKYISQEEASDLLKLVANESDFLKQIDLLIE